MIEDGALLFAPYVLEYTYRRSVGAVMGRFFAALRERQILGLRTSSGRVVAPPTEHDPETGAPCDELVNVGPDGVVTTWSWTSEPRPGQPLGGPFAWALIRLDGADTAMLHAVDARSADRMQTGMRVRARWRDERVGAIRDIVCFDVVGEPTGEATR